jgi:heterodisulfide reductase subunit A-like polyferredoxin
VLQTVIIYLFAPSPDTITLEPSSNPLGRIAIIGAGITGVSTAAHFLAHGFEVIIFEQSENIGGIWSRVNRYVASILTIPISEPILFSCARLARDVSIHF